MCSHWKWCAREHENRLNEIDDQKEQIEGNWTNLVSKRATSDERRAKCCKILIIILLKFFFLILPKQKFHFLSGKNYYSWKRKKEGKKKTKKRKTWRKLKQNSCYTPSKFSNVQNSVRFIFLIRLHRELWMNGWEGVGAEELYTNKYSSLQLIGLIFKIKSPKMCGAICSGI